MGRHGAGDLEAQRKAERQDQWCQEQARHGTQKEGRGGREDDADQDPDLTAFQRPDLLGAHDPDTNADLQEPIREIVE
jgi:hypothetical protein